MPFGLPSPFGLFNFTSPSPVPSSSTLPAGTLPSPASQPPSRSSTASPAQSRRLPPPPLRGSALGEGAEEEEAALPSASGFKRDRSASDQTTSTEGQRGVEPASKKRRGIVGGALSTAFDAAIFATALSYSAYRLWKTPPTQEELDAHYRQKRLTDAPPPLPIEAPPPYSEALSPRPSSSLSNPGVPSPSQIPRRVPRHIHPPRPRPIPRSSYSNRSSSSFPSASIATLPPQPPLPDNFDPFANLTISGPMPSFQPYSSPRRAQGGVSPRVPGGFNGEQDGEDGQEEEGESEEDEEFRAVEERMRKLIEEGASALLSRPEPAPRGASREWETGSLAPLPSTSANFTSRSPLSPSSASLSRARSLGGLASASSPRHSLPAFSHSTSRPSSSSSSYALSAPPPRSPRISNHSLTAHGHARRQSADVSSLASFSTSHHHLPHPSHATASPRHSMPHPPVSPRAIWGSPSASSASTSAGMRRAVTAGGGGRGHSRHSSVIGPTAVEVMEGAVRRGRGSLGPPTGEGR